ncbi:MAG TPA: hypothetical protein VMV49_11275, partial [Candidatus Deferrimicrobium sp.]|nr:hypothetical protein [Candidatus Deferrimicrobium sp.]
PPPPPPPPMRTTPPPPPPPPPMRTTLPPPPPPPPFRSMIPQKPQESTQSVEPKDIEKKPLQISDKDITGLLAALESIKPEIIQVHEVPVSAIEKPQQTPLSQPQQLPTSFQEEQIVKEIPEKTIKEPLNPINFLCPYCKQPLSPQKLKNLQMGISVYCPNCLQLVPHELIK